MDTATSDVVAGGAPLPVERRLLERETDLSALAAAVDAAVGGGGRILLIEGAAGIGKTSLLQEARAQADAVGLRVLAARASELERAYAFGVVRQLLEPALARSTPGERSAATAGAAALAAGVLGLERATDQGTVQDAFAVLHGLYWLTVNLTDAGPLLLAIDDLHWVDADSLQWLGYLARRLEGVPILVAATLRPLAVDADPVLAGLVADPATVVIRPRPLSTAATAALLADHLAAGTFEEVASAARESTGGNPLLLHELLGALAAELPTGSAAEAVAAVRQLAPGVVARRVRLELARLGAETAALARAVAVLGEGAASELVAHLAELDGDAAREASVRLASSGLLASDEPLRFAHPLLREAVYETIPAADRTRAHERAAQLLEAQAAPVGEVAAQLLLTPPGRRQRVVETFRHAAREALAAGARETAAAYLRRALAEPPTGTVRADVLLELANVESELGTAADRLREVVPLLEGERRTRARITLARMLIWASEDEQAADEIQAALDEESHLDARLRRTLIVDYYAAAHRVPHLHAKAHALLRDVEADDEHDLSSRELLAVQAFAAAREGTALPQAVQLAERALSHGMSPEEAPGWSLWGAVSVLQFADRFDLPLAVVDEAIADGRRRGAVYLFSGASMVRASLNHARGALAEAEADARTAADALPYRHAVISPLVYGVLVEVLVDLGRFEAAAEALRESGGEAPLPETFGWIQLIHARGRLRLAQGNPSGALADALACGRAFDSVAFANPAAARWRSAAALAHLAAGDTDDARRLAFEEVELARAWGAPRALGRALRNLGLTEGGTTGIERLRESVVVLQESPARLERAHSLTGLGSALRRAGRKTEARDRLRAGLDLAHHCGATPLAEQARAELVAAGAKPRSLAVSGAAALTPSERRIAALAAEGMTNREIAQALFVAPRTVEMHLSNTFRKLRIGSRTQLAKTL